MALSAIHSRPEVKMIGADLIRAWVARSGESELQRALSLVVNLLFGRGPFFISDFLLTAACKLSL